MRLRFHIVDDDGFRRSRFHGGNERGDPQDIPPIVQKHSEHRERHEQVENEDCRVNI